MKLSQGFPTLYIGDEKDQHEIIKYTSFQGSRRPPGRRIGSLQGVSRWPGRRPEMTGVLQALNESYPRDPHTFSEGTTRALPGTYINGLRPHRT